MSRAKKKDLSELVSDPVLKIDETFYGCQDLSYASQVYIKPRYSI